jgi:hypothetical protein
VTATPASWRRRLNAAVRAARSSPNARTRNG